MRRNGAFLLFVDSADCARKTQSEQIYGGELRRKRLCRGNGYLGACNSIYNIVALSRYRALDDVDYRHGMRAAALCLAQGGEGIRRLARLAYNHAQVVLPDYGVPVAEFARKVALAEYTRGALYKIFRGHADVPCAAAGDDMDHADILNLLIAERELRQMNSSVNYSAAQSVAHGLGLLGNLFFMKCL